MNSDSSGEPQTVLPEIGQPQLKERPRSLLRDVEGDWLCAWCLNRVANEKDRFRVQGQDEFTFSNPDGIRFEILTFSELCGCDRTGTPTLEHTWFPGYSWLFCQCSECGQHLGWYYSGPQDFAGLIKPRIVRAVCIRN